jgi:hypothetical protein
MSNSKTPAARSAELAHAHESTRREAQELLAAAGTSDHAQRAVDSAAGRPRQSTAQSDAFARKWNFGSYLEMFEASKPLSTIDGKHWLVTNTGGQQWIVWNDEDLSAAYTVGSVREAEELVGKTNPTRATKEATPPTG